jgi:predicted ribosome quality control (RQC) complex YloA/Tae2 family protein
MKKFTFLILVFAGISSSCGSDHNKTTFESKDGTVKVENLKEAGEQMEKAVQDADKRREERRKRGDTLAMNYKDFQTYLPEVSGYSREGNPEGESMSMAGMGSFSTATQRYGSGDKEIEIQLIDYNQSVMGYTAATAMFSMNMQIENDQERSGTFETGIEGVRGFQQVYKTEQRAEVMNAIADRFFLTIKSNGSNDAEALKQIAKSMKLDDLDRK